MNNKTFVVGAALGALFLVPALQPAQAAQYTALGRVAATQAVEFDVHLPLRNSAELDTLIREQGDATSPLYHHFLSTAQFRAAFGPSAGDVRRTEAFFKASGLTVMRAQTQLLHVRGSSAQVERAFTTRLGAIREHSGRIGIAAMQAVRVPATLSALGATVTGLAYTVKPQPLVRRANGPQNRYSTLGPYFFTDLKQAYSYPSYSANNGAGVTIATVGESDFNGDDANLYFAHEGLGPGGIGPRPAVYHVLLPGAEAFDPNTSISAEANLDVQQAGGSAPGATILGISINGPGEAFLEAYSFIDEYNVADIVSTSYGECELYYTPAYNGGVDQSPILHAYHDLFRQGNSQGITFVFSSGDDSGLGCYPLAYLVSTTHSAYSPIPGAGIWVDDPNATAVGGTNLVTTYKPGSFTSKYVSENEIGDRIATPVDPYGTGNFIKNGLFGSGGGVSTIFAKPAFQNLVHTGYNTRTDPDVSMHMGGCPYEGPGVVVNCGSNRDSADLAAIGGQFFGLLGTSASAPEFAGLLALKASALHSRLGNENTDIYTLAKNNSLHSYHYFHQGIQAYNGVVTVKKGQLGYNIINGVGTPYGSNFIGMPTAPLAGDPLTASNP